MLIVQNQVLPLYASSPACPYLLATANWILGELASCLPEVRWSMLCKFHFIYTKTVFAAPLQSSGYMTFSNKHARLHCQTLDYWFSFPLASGNERWCIFFITQIIGHAWHWEYILLSCSDFLSRSYFCIAWSSSCFSCSESYLLKKKITFKHLELFAYISM